MKNGGRRKGGGRPKGARNKTSRPIKEQLQTIISDLVDTIPQLMDSLDSIDKLSFIVKLLPFICAPAQPETDSRAEHEATASAIAEKVYEKMLVHTGAQIQAQKELEADYRYNS